MKGVNSLHFGFAKLQYVYMIASKRHTKKYTLKNLKKRLKLQR